MMASIPKILTLSLFGASLAGLSGCRGSGVQASGNGSAADISGPPTMNADYGARNPRTCGKVTSPPDTATAKALVQCANEGFRNSEVWLITDLRLEIGAPRASTYADADINDLDVNAKIYPLRGSGTNWACGLVSQYGAGTNCQKWPAGPDLGGRCWRTLFGDWKCNMGVGNSPFVTNQPGPTTY
jgi:hypothetical protein